jgi:hypothetical protein
MIPAEMILKKNYTKCSGFFAIRIISMVRPSIKPIEEARAKIIYNCSGYFLTYLINVFARLEPL